MIINKEWIFMIMNFLDSEYLWLYFSLIILAFYLLLCLFTWSFKRPFLFLGIPSIILGMLLLALYFIIGVIPLEETLINVLQSSTKPLFNVGLICLIMGIVMIIINRLLSLLNKKNKKETIIDMESNESTLENIEKETNNING